MEAFIPVIQPPQTASVKWARFMVLLQCRVSEGTREVEDAWPRRGVRWCLIVIHIELLLRGTAPGLVQYGVGKQYTVVHWEHNTIIKNNNTRTKLVFCILTVVNLLLPYPI